MKRVFRNDLILLSRSKALRIDIIIVFIFSLMALIFRFGSETTFGYAGWQVPFIAAFDFGVMGYILVTVIVNSIFVSPIEGKMAQMLFARGVDRIKWTLSKIACSFIGTVVLIVVEVVLETASVTLRNGFGDPGEYIDNYLAALCVGLLAVFSLFALYVSVVFLAGAITGNGVFTFVISVCMMMADLLLGAGRIRLGKGLSVFGYFITKQNIIIRTLLDGNIVSWEFGRFIIFDVVAAMIVFAIGTLVVLKRDL